MALSTGPSPLVLASGSAIRRTLLEGAGVAFTIDLPDVSEQAIKAGHQGTTEQLAMALADAKARNVSDRRPNAWVIGSDSIAECGGRRFDKPRDRAEAAEHLRFFSGRSLSLVSAASLVRNGSSEAALVDRARLAVRPLSNAFIADYLKAEWPAVGECAGAFRLEGRGVTLFDAIDGSHFTILGLPLLPLLGALRERGIVAS